MVRPTARGSHWAALIVLSACSNAPEGSGAGGTGGAGGARADVPVIERFESDSEGFGVEGGEATLSWTVVGADTVEIDSGVGTVDGSEATVTVTETTVFTLTATNARGEAEARTVVIVASSKPPPIDRTAPNAADQIDEALALAQIDDVTALRYKVFALHGDDRLPPEYDADGPIHGTPIMRELARRFDELPTETQSEMRPFQLPPDDPDSWYVLSGGSVQKGGTEQAWQGPVLVADGKVAIKWETSLSAGQPLYAAIRELYAAIIIPEAADHAYRKHIEYMERPPIGDGIDPDVYPVYIISSSSAEYLGLTTPTVPTSGKWKSHLTINLWGIVDELDDSPDLSSSDLVSATVAHELFHSFQFAFKVERGTAEEDWLGESTATWVEHHIYPSFNTEHGYAEVWFHRPYVSLDDLRGTHAYGGYLFHLFLTERLGDKDLVHRFWEQSESEPIFPAINTVVGGRLVDLWAEFVVTNWNADGIQQYQIWDDLYQGVSGTNEGAPASVVNPGPAFVKPFLLDREDEDLVGPSIPGVRSLSAQYFRLTFEDDEVRSLLFANGFNYELAHGAPSDLPIQYDGDEFYITTEDPADRERNTRTQVLVKSQGEWSGPYDLTDVPFVALCQDLPEESVEELVVIFANGNFEEGKRLGVVPKGIGPVLMASNMACGRWEGTAGAATTVTPAGENPTFTLLEFSEVTFDNKPENKLAFSRDPVPIEDLMEGLPTTVIGRYVFSAFLTPSYQFTLSNADVHWTVTRTSSEGAQSCQGDGATMLDETQLWGSLSTFNHFLPDDPFYRGYFIDIGPLVELTYDLTCTLGGGGQNSVGFDISNSSDGPYRMEGDGISISDTVQSTVNSGSVDRMSLQSWALSGAPEQGAP